jgi:hypothetical protein
MRGWFLQILFIQLATPDCLVKPATYQAMTIMAESEEYLAENFFDKNCKSIKNSHGNC